MLSESSRLVFHISLISAVVTIAFFAALIYRRWRLEQQESYRRSTLAAVTRSYVRRVAGHLDYGALTSWPAPIRLEAVSHLHLLLRGGERERLMQMAELDGLLDETIRQSTRRRASRRINAVRLLQQFGSEACVARLRQMMVRDKSPLVRLEAAFALASMRALPPPREVIRILGLFSRPTRRLDSALLRSTAPDYADQLQMILDDPITPGQKALIIDALGWSEDLAVLPALARAAESENPELRSAALRAATKLGHSGATSWAQTMLYDPVPFVRVQAINCCVALGMRSAARDIEALLGDDDQWVRIRAEEALMALVGDRAVPQHGEIGHDAA